MMGAVFRECYTPYTLKIPFVDLKKKEEAYFKYTIIFLIAPTPFSILFQY